MIKVAKRICLSLREDRLRSTKTDGNSDSTKMRLLGPRRHSTFALRHSSLLDG